MYYFDIVKDFKLEDTKKGLFITDSKKDGRSATEHRKGISPQGRMGKEDYQ